MKNRLSQKYFDGLFLNEKWIRAVFDNNKWTKRFKLLFNFNAYSDLMNLRMTFQMKYIYIISDFKLEKSNISSNNAVCYTLIEHVASYLELEFKKYHNNTFNNIKNKRFLNKTIKKKLFHWRGMWAD